MDTRFSLNPFLSASDEMLRVRRSHADWFGHDEPSRQPEGRRASAHAIRQEAFNDNLFLHLVRPSSFEDVQAPKIEMSSLALAMLQEARDTVEASARNVVVETNVESPCLYEVFSLRKTPSLYDMVEDESGVYHAASPARSLVDA